MNPLSLLPGPSFLWRLGAYAALFVAGLGIGASKMHSHDQARYDSLEAGVKAAGDAQNALSAQKDKTWKQLVEATEREAKLRNDKLARDLGDARMRVTALASRRLVPPAPSAAPSDQRICYAREQLDRGLHESLARLYQRVVELSEQGQRDRDIAIACADYVRGLSSSAK